MLVAIMAAVFWLTFNVIGAALSNLLDMGISALTNLVDGALTSWNVNSVIHSLVIDGIFNGVGSVFKFPSGYRYLILFPVHSGRQRIYGKSCICDG